MKLFTIIIILVFAAEGEIVVEEINEDENTDHVANIKSRYQRKSHSNDKQCALLVFHNLFHTVNYQRKQHQRIHPHGIMTEGNNVSGERVHGGE